MSTIDAAKDLIYNYFNTEWTTTHSRTEPFAVEGEVVDPLDSVFNSTGGPWLRLLVDENDGGQVNLGPIGSRKYERMGQIMVQVFVPGEDASNDATETLDTLLQTVRDILEGVSFSGINTFRAVQRPLDEPQRDGRWNGKILDIEYRYEETK